MAPISSRPVLKVTTLNKINELVTGSCSGSSSSGLADDRVERLILMASAQIEQFLRRSLKREAFEEKLTVYPQQQIFSLFHSPIQEITAITNDETVLELDQFTFDDYALTARYPPYPMEDGMNFLTVEGTGGMAATTSEFMENYPDIAGEAENWIIVRAKLLANPEVKSKGYREQHVSFYDTQMPESLISALYPHQRRW